MAGLTSLYTAVSGMNAARTALAVIGHNMANVDTPGFSRQRIVQHEFWSQTVGNSAGTPMQVGLGTDYHGIQQIRNKYLDITYRDEVGKSAFYGAKAAAGNELEITLGELQSDFQTQSVITDLWNAIEELSVYQPGLDTRGNFVSTCVTFLNKAENVYDRLTDYQRNLNEQVIKTVQDINTLVTKVNGLNKEIVGIEVSGDRANDYRDQLNLAIDDLSALCDVTVKYDSKGQIALILEGTELLANGSASRIGFKYTASQSALVEPVFTNSEDTLPFNSPANTYRPVYSLTGDVNSYYNNDKGLLKGLLVARGHSACNYASPQKPELYEVDEYGNYKLDGSGNKIDILDTNGQKLYPKGEADPLYILQTQKNVFDARYSVVAKAMRDFDVLVNSVVTMMNDMVAPPDVTQNADGVYQYVNEAGDPVDVPYDLNGEQSFLEIFVREHHDRYAQSGSPVTYTYIEENAAAPSTLYSMGNIKINPLLQDASGYTKIALSRSGDLEDTRVVLDMLSAWTSEFIDPNNPANPTSDGLMPRTNPSSVDGYYTWFITDIATTVSESVDFANEQDVLVESLSNKRHEVSSVSLDEEMEFMLKYQHAYNASARIVNVIDEMLRDVLSLKS